MAGRKILVADDSLTIQKVIRLALSNEGYEIQTVSDGNEALQQISTFRPDLVLVDISLPGQDAIEIKNSVSLVDDLAGTPFVLMSSAFEKVDEVKVSAAQFDGRLTKPFDPAHLRAVLSEVLARPARQKGKSESGGSKIDIGAPVFDEPPPLPPTGLPAFEFKPGGPSDSDSDIKRLTESTIRMSGLDDMAAWSVNEPVIKPPSRVLDDAPPSLMRSSGPPAAPMPGMDANLDEVIRAKVEEQVARLAQKILPEVAERVIKAEINRLLRELN